MIQFVLENSKRTKYNIDAVGADGMMNQEKVTNSSGLPNVIFMADDFHTLDFI